MRTAAMAGAAVGRSGRAGRSEAALMSLHLGHRILCAHAITVRFATAARCKASRNCGFCVLCRSCSIAHLGRKNDKGGFPVLYPSALLGGSATDAPGCGPAAKERSREQASLGDSRLVHNRRRCKSFIPPERRHRDEVDDDVHPESTIVARVSLILSHRTQPAGGGPAMLRDDQRRSETECSGGG